MFVFFFFFKQKTAYEIRPCDWSSDVCSSDLTERTPAFGEPEAVRLALESIPAGGLLVLGNSLPVRLVDSFVRAGGTRVRVASQRGANGIDGLVAGAAGSALAARCPTLLLLGDVSLAHD